MIEYLSRWLFKGYQTTQHQSKLSDSARGDDSAQGDDPDLINFLRTTIKLLAGLSVIIVLIFIPITTFSIWPEILPSWVVIEAKLDGQTLSGYVTGIFSIAISLSGAFVAINLAKLANQNAAEANKLADNNALAANKVAEKIAEDEKNLQIASQRYERLRDALSGLLTEVQNSLAVVKNFNRNFARFEKALEVLHNQKIPTDNKEFHDEYCRAFLNTQDAVSSMPDEWMLSGNTGNIDWELFDILRKHRTSYRIKMDGIDFKLSNFDVAFTAAIVGIYCAAYVRVILKNLYTKGINDEVELLLDLVAGGSVDNDLKSAVKYTETLAKKMIRYEFDRSRFDADSFAYLKKFKDLGAMGKFTSRKDFEKFLQKFKDLGVMGKFTSRKDFEKFLNNFKNLGEAKKSSPPEDFVKIYNRLVEALAVDELRDIQMSGEGVSCVVNNIDKIVVVDDA